MIRLFGISHLNYVCYAVFVVIDAPIRIFSILRGRFTLPFGLIKFEFECVYLLLYLLYSPVVVKLGSSSCANLPNVTEHLQKTFHFPF